ARDRPPCARQLPVVDRGPREPEAAPDAQPALVEVARLRQRDAPVRARGRAALLRTVRVEGDRVSLDLGRGAPPAPRDADGLALAPSRAALAGGEAPGALADGRDRPDGAGLVRHRGGSATGDRAGGGTGRGASRGGAGAIAIDRVAVEAPARLD